MAPIQEVLHIPGTDSGVPSSDSNTISLVNTQRVRSEESFELCETGAPQIYDDYVLVESQDGTAQKLCRDKAQPLLEARYFWPLSKDWNQIRSWLESATKQGEVAEKLAKLKTYGLFLAWPLPCVFVAERWESLNALQKNAAWETLLTFRHSDLTVVQIESDPLYQVPGNREGFLEKLEAIAQAREFSERMEILRSPNDDFLTRLKAADALVEQKDQLTSAQGEEMWPAVLEIRFQQLESTVHSREGAIDWIERHAYENFNEWERERYHDDLRSIMEAYEHYPATVAAVAALGKFDHPRLQTLLAQALAESSDPRRLAENMVTKLRELALPLEPELQSALVSFLDGTHFSNFSTRQEIISLVTARGTATPQLIAALEAVIITRNEDYEVTTAALDALAWADLKEMLSFSRRIVVREVDSERTDFLRAIPSIYDQPRRAAIKALTGVYIRYQETWDEDRVQIAQLLMNALQARRICEDYSYEQVAQALAIYPCVQIRGEMQEALGEFQRERDFWLVQQKYDAELYYGRLITSANRVIEDLQRGLQKLEEQG